MVAPPPPRRPHDRLRAGRCGSPLAYVQPGRGLSPLLRLGSLRRPGLRGRTCVTLGPATRAAALRGRRAGLALAHRAAPVDPVQRRLRAREGRGPPAGPSSPPAAAPPRALPAGRPPLRRRRPPALAGVHRTV